MHRDEARIWFVRYLMRKIRADTYPSRTDLDLLEMVIPDHMLEEYVQILIDKVEDDRYPSICLLRRIKRVLECLPRRAHEAEEDLGEEAG